MWARELPPDTPAHHLLDASDPNVGCAEGCPHPDHTYVEEADYARPLMEACRRWVKSQDISPDGDVLPTSENQFMMIAEMTYYAMRRVEMQLRERERSRLPERHWGVYLLFDHRDVVFYVGMSGVPRRRVAKHRREFAEHIARVEWRPTPTRRAALDLESQLIAELDPRMNIAQAPL